MLFWYSNSFAPTQTAGDSCLEAVLLALSRSSLPITCQARVP